MARRRVLAHGGMNEPGQRRADIDTPALLVDLDVMERNIATMSAFFAGRSTTLRPHFKSPKTPAIARRLLAAGAVGMTCAKVGEAEVLVEHGVRDILVANQVVGPHKIDRLVRLARRADLMVAVDDGANVAALAAAARAAGVTLRVLIEVDVGMHRCGVRTPAAALTLAAAVAQSPALRLAGVMGYEGHAVMVADRAQRAELAATAMTTLLAATEALRSAGHAVEIVSAGGTGTYDMTGALNGVTEIQAGSYVLMDTRYREVDVPFACALSLLTTVVSVPDPHTALIDAGMKAMTFEFGLPAVKDRPGTSLVYLSEEHGHLMVDGPPLQPGDRLELTPSHSDTTINLHDRLYAMRGDHIEEVWTIEARGKFT
jgi:D-serine deaminase-like pyridoxal phosphate-dependent protein